MAWGVVANAVVTGAASAAYGLAAREAWRRQRFLGRGARAAPVLFAVIALFLFLAALRQVAAWLSEGRPAWVEVDRGLFYLLLAPASLSVVPLVYLVARARWDDRRRAAWLAAGFLAVIAVGLAFGYAEGVAGPLRSPYGTDWELRSVVSRVLVAVAILVPSLAASGVLVASARSMAEPDRRRIRLIGLSSLLYFALFTADAYGLPGIALLGARVGTAVAGLVAWRAHRAPIRPVEKRP